MAKKNTNNKENVAVESDAANNVDKASKKKEKKKGKKRFRRFIAVTLSWFLLVNIVIIALLQACLLWLNTDQGGVFLQRSINKVLAGSGYSIEAESFSLTGYLGIKAESLTVKNQDDLITSVKGARIGLNIAELGIGRVSVHIAADELNLYKLPASENDKDIEEDDSINDQEDLNIVLPDTFLKKIYITVSSNKTIIHEGVAGEQIVFGVEVVQLLSLENNMLSLLGDINFNAIQGQAIVYAPTRIKNNIILQADTKDIGITALSVNHPDYEGQLIGQYNLDTGFISSDIQASIENSKGGLERLDSPISVTANVNGTASDLQANAEISTVFENHDTTLSIQALVKHNIITIENLNGNGQGFNLNGDLIYNLDQKVADGDLLLNVRNLDIANIFVQDKQIEGAGEAKISLSANQEGRQALNVDAAFNAIRYQDIFIQSVIGNIKADDLSQLAQITSDLHIQKLRAGQTVLDQTHLTLRPENNTLNISFKSDGFNVNKFSLDAMAKVKAISPINVDISKIQFKTKSGQLTASGGVSPDNLNIKLTGGNIQTATLPFVDLSTLPIVIQTVNGSVSGDFNAPKADLNFSVMQSNTAAISDALSDTVLKGQIKYSGKDVNIAVNAKGTGIKRFDVTVSVPLQLKLQPFEQNISADTNLSGYADLNLDIQALSPFFLPDQFNLSGDLNAQAKVDGTLGKPLYDGQLSLSNSIFLDQASGFQLNNIKADASFNNDTVRLVSLTADDGSNDGRLNADALLQTRKDAPPKILANLKMNNMNLLRGDQYDAWLNTDLNIQSNDNGVINVSGLINPKDISIRLPERFGGSIPKLNIVKAKNSGEDKPDMLSNILLDIDFKAANQIFVSGWGLDSEFKGDLKITGTAKKPLINGSLESIRGRLKEFGRTFDLTKANIRFQGPVPPSPYLDIQTAADVDGITAQINISGKAADPKIKLSSSPSLPEDEIVSLILFGENVEQISAFQALKLANAMRRFSGKGGGGIDPLEKIQSATGLDDIRVEGVGTDNASVGAGKYISEKVYLEVEQGAEAGSGAASVQVELTPNITVESQASQNGESDVGVFWEWEY